VSEHHDDPRPRPGEEGSPEAHIEAFVNLVSAVERAPAYRGRLARAVSPPLPHSGISVLTIAERFGPLGVKEIAERLGVEQSTASRQIRPLEAAGLLARDPDPTDGRAVRLRITDAGRRARERVRQVWLADIAYVLRDWDEDDRVMLGDLLARFRESFLELADRRPSPRRPGPGS
jgi:DNA-binding MarR family transcriptional regulator